MSIWSIEELQQSTISRNDFLDSDEIVNVQRQIRENEPIDFMPNSIQEVSLPKKMENGQYVKFYYIIMYGVLTSGENVTVKINDIRPYFEVRVPDGKTIPEFTNILESYLEASRIDYNSTENYKQVQTANEYNDFADVVRIYFNDTRARNDAIKLFSSNQLRYQLFHNENTCYYRVYGRDFDIMYTSWIRLYKYKAKRIALFNTDLTFTVTTDNIKNVPENEILSTPKLRSDVNVKLCFDIETHNDIVTGEVPKPYETTSDMFAISMAFINVDGALSPLDNDHKQSDNILPHKHMAYFVLVMGAIITPIPNRTVILCKDKREMIIAYAFLFSRFRPNIIVGFNNDNYDSWWIAETSRQCGLMPLLEESMSFINLSIYHGLINFRFNSNPSSPFVIEQEETDNGRSSFNSYRYWSRYLMKIAAEHYVSGTQLAYPGYVCIDMMQQLREMNGNPDSYSLNYFLGKYKILGKNAMDYNVMFEIYRRNRAILRKLAPLHDMKVETIIKAAKAKNLLDELLRSSNDMIDVAEYCIIDAVRCHDLMVVTDFVRNKRSFGMLSHTHLWDCVYRANGMKVRNMVFGNGKLRNIRMQSLVTEQREKGKYPGAFVFPPDKGLAAARPHIQELLEDERDNAASSPDGNTPTEWLSLSEETMNYLFSLIKRYGIRFDEYPESILKTVPEVFIKWLSLDHHYPIAGLDFTSLYPSIIMTYNFSPEMIIYSLDKALSTDKELHRIEFQFNGRTIQAWSVRSNYMDYEAEIKQLIDDGDFEAVEKKLHSAEFGIFPTVLLILFNSRLKLKAELKPLAKRKEELELLPSDEFKANAEIYAEVMFRYNYINSKQQALKVFMNTFYGETGNINSPLYILPIAGGITTAGKYNIKLAEDEVLRLGCRIYYGDTDSIYISMPRKVFMKVDNDYYSRDWSVNSKVDYYRALVTISFIEIKHINESVNTMLLSDNRTRFLRMAFEEFLYPASFLSKKKYCGVAHLDKFNENPKGFFVRGLEYVKKGTCLLLKDLSEDVLWKVFDIRNIHPMYDVVKKVFENAYKAEIPIEKYTLMATYKPTKKNVKVITFRRRMDQRAEAERASGNKENFTVVPAPLDRFQYVIVKKPKCFDIKGRILPISVGDMMEYPSTVLRDNMEINKYHYMSSSIAGQLGRYVSYDSRFYIPPVDDSDEAYSDSDKKSTDLAKKHIIEWCKMKEVEEKDMGPVYKKLFRSFIKHFDKLFFDVMPASDIWAIDFAKSDKARRKTKVEMCNEIHSELKAIIEKKVSKNVIDAKQKIKAEKLTASEMLLKYNNIQRTLKIDYPKKMQLYEKQIRTHVEPIYDMLTRRDNIIKKYIDEAADANTDINMTLIKNNVIEDIKETMTENDVVYVNNVNVIIANMHTLIGEYVSVQNIIDECKAIIQSEISASVNLDDLKDWVKDNI